MNALQQYPWITPLYQSLLRNQQQSKLPHALLVTGIDGLGKLAMSQLFANTLLCQKPVATTTDEQITTPCGHCHDCQLFQAENHPDYLFIEPEKKAGNILVDQIRKLTDFVSLKSHLGGMQIILINQAHSLNRNAANSLLKTLEEPTQNVLLLLVSSNPNRLPATVKSRCQRRVMEAPVLDSALQWLSATDSSHSPERAAMALKLSSGAPILAHSYLVDGVLALYYTQFKQFLGLSSQQVSVVDVAAMWSKENTHLSVHWLLYWVSRLIHIKFRLPTADTVIAKDEQQLQNLSITLDLASLYKYYDKLLASVKLLDTQVNNQLLLEDLLISWRQLQGQR